jgi:uncharacterized protein with HEPN domain
MSRPRLGDYLQHIRQAASDALAFTEGMTEAAFAGDRRTQQAVVMNLIIIGEAATRIMDAHPDFVARHPEVPWRSMRGMRNRIAHAYFEIDLPVVWKTVRDALPSLLGALPETD